MKPRTGRRRYGHIGAVYDVISLERWLYRRPRQRLHDMIGPQPGATIVDAGCGTGLNFDGLTRLVGPAGRVIGFDASPSMLAAANRRTRTAGWVNVSIIESDIADVPSSLGASGIPISSIDVVIATFVVSTLRDASPFWRSVDEITAPAAPVLVALADIGRAESARRLPAIAFNTLAALGGNQQQATPRNDLARRSPDAVTETHLGGHVHLTLGHCGHLPRDGTGAGAAWPCVDHRAMRVERRRLQFCGMGPGQSSQWSLTRSTARRVDRVLSPVGQRAQVLAVGATRSAASGPVPSPRPRRRCVIDHRRSSETHRRRAGSLARDGQRRP